MILPIRLDFATPAEFGYNPLMPISTRTYLYLFWVGHALVLAGIAAFAWYAVLERLPPAIGPILALLAFQIWSIRDFRWFELSENQIQVFNVFAKQVDSCPVESLRDICDTGSLVIPTFELTAVLSNEQRKKIYHCYLFMIFGCGPSLKPLHRAERLLAKLRQPTLSGEWIKNSVDYEIQMRANEIKFKHVFEVPKISSFRYDELKFKKSKWDGREYFTWPDGTRVKVENSAASLVNHLFVEEVRKRISEAKNHLSLPYPPKVPTI